MYNSWNDLGARLSLENDNLNMVIYLVNGQNLEDYQVKTQSIGGRIGMLAADTTIGASYANDSTKHDVFIGMDFAYDLKNLSILYEFLNVNNFSHNNANSYYIQAKYDFGLFFILSRFGTYSEKAGYDRDNDNYSDLERLSFGMGIKIERKTEFRFEYQLNSEKGEYGNNDNEAILFQTVFGF